MRHRLHIVIAGAGALGRTLAVVLASAGHVVTIVDPGGSNASGVAAGMLAPAFESLFDLGAPAFATLRSARDLWLPLADRIGLSIERYGAMAQGDLAQLEAWRAQLAAFGATASLVDGGGGPAVFTPDDWRVDPVAALAALEAEARKLGVIAVVGRVRDVAAGGALIDNDARVLTADVVILATGAAANLARMAPALRRLTPVKGHILRAAALVGQGPVVRASGVYLCRAGGEAVLGATMEIGRSDTEVDPEVIRGLLADAAPLVRGFGRLEWRAAAGVRAATPDGWPLVGASGTPGVWLATGARRNGWLLAPLIAEVILDHLEGRPARAEAKLFDPARFSQAAEL